MRKAMPRSSLGRDILLRVSGAFHEPGGSSWQLGVSVYTSKQQACDPSKLKGRAMMPGPRLRWCVITIVLCWFQTGMKRNACRKTVQEVDDYKDPFVQARQGPSCNLWTCLGFCRQVTLTSCNSPSFATSVSSFQLIGHQGASAKAKALQSLASIPSLDVVLASTCISCLLFGIAESVSSTMYI